MVQNGMILPITIVECIIGFLGFVANSFVLLAIYKERRLQSITNCFVGSLALSDLLVGLVIPPVAVATYHGRPATFLTCVFFQSATTVSTQISVINLMTIAIERFLAIRIPFEYKLWMTMNRALKIVAATWLLAIIIGLIPTMGWNCGAENFSSCTFRKVIPLEYMVYLIFLVYTVPPLIVMAAAYVYIFLVVRKTKAAIKKLMVRHISNTEKLTRHVKTHTRGDLSIIMVIFMYILCWMPFHIVNCIELWSSGTVGEGVYLTTVALTHVNSICNPFLFAFGYTQFQVTLYNLLFGACLPKMADPEMIDRRPSKRRSAALPTDPFQAWHGDKRTKTIVVHMLGSSITITDSSLDDIVCNLENFKMERIYREPSKADNVDTSERAIMDKKKINGRAVSSEDNSREFYSQESSAFAMTTKISLAERIGNSSGAYDGILNVTLPGVFHADISKESDELEQDNAKEILSRNSMKKDTPGTSEASIIAYIIPTRLNADILEVSLTRKKKGEADEVLLATTISDLQVPSTANLVQVLTKLQGKKKSSGKMSVSDRDPSLSPLLRTLSGTVAGNTAEKRKDGESFGNESDQPTDTMCIRPTNSKTDSLMNVTDADINSVQSSVVDLGAETKTLDTNALRSIKTDKKPDTTVGNETQLKLEIHKHNSKIICSKEADTKENKEQEQHGMIKTMSNGFDTVAPGEGTLQANMFRPRIMSSEVDLEAAKFQQGQHRPSKRSSRVDFKGLPVVAGTSGHSEGGLSQAHTKKDQMDPRPRL